MAVVLFTVNYCFPFYRNPGTPDNTIVVVRAQIGRGTKAMMGGARSVNRRIRLRNNSLSGRDARTISNRFENITLIVVRRRHVRPSVRVCGARRMRIGSRWYLTLRYDNKNNNNK